MRFKKALALLLTCSIIVTEVPVFAAEKEDSSGKENILAAKEELKVDELGLSEDEKEALALETEGFFFEMGDYREENKKHIRQPDGSISAIMYDIPVHYMNSKGKWDEIDNTMKEIKAPEYLKPLLIPDSEKVLSSVLFGSENGAVQKTFSKDLSSGLLYAEQYKDLSLAVFLENDEKSRSYEADDAFSYSSDFELEFQHEEGDEEEDEEATALETEETPSDSVAEMQEENPEDSEGVSEDEEKSSEQADSQVQEVDAVSEDALNSVDVDKEEHVNELKESRTTVQGASFYHGDASATLLEPSEKHPDRMDAKTLEEASYVKNLSAGLIYKDVYPGVDFQYESYSYDIKENIQIREKQDSYVYPFLIRANRLQAKLLDDGSVCFFDKRSGEEIYQILTPFMIDAKGEVSYDASYSLEEVKVEEKEKEVSTYRLILKADENWINAPERAFPVTIDPTQKLKSGNSVNDITTTYVLEGNPTKKQSGYRSIFVGYGSSSTSKQHNAYVHVNTLPTIPANCIPVNAQLAYYCPYSTGWSTVGIDKLNLECHELTPSTTPSDYVSWIRNLTWNTKPSHAGTAIDYVTMSADAMNTYVAFDVTEAAKKWYGDSSTNKGLGIIPAAYNYGSARAALAILQGYGETLPSLFYVTYRNMVGMESYYTGQQESIDGAGEAYISDYTGELTLTHEDMNWESVCNGFALSHVYNSVYRNNQFTAHKSDGITTRKFKSMKLGAGWKLSAQQTVQAVIADPECNYLLWNDGDGTEHYFRETASGSNKYEDEDGLGLTIEKKNQSGATVFYSMTDEDTYHTWEFYNGFLSTIKDSNGNQIFIAYNNPYNENNTNWKPFYTEGTNEPAENPSNKIVQIVSKPNESGATVLATMAYNGEFLQSITDYRGDVTSFSYSGGKLVTITESSGQTISYTYDSSSGKMTSATDNESQYGMDFVYGNYGFGKTGITQVREYVLSGGTKSYGNGYKLGKVSRQLSFCRYFGPDHVSSDEESTKADDTILYTSFDYAARTINQYETDNTGTVTGVEMVSYTSETANSKKSNKITKASAMGLHGTNLLLNSGAEDTVKELWSVQGVGSSITGGTESSVTGQTAENTNVTIKPRTGQKMVHLKETASAAGSSTGMIYKTVTLQAGKSYVLSAYLNSRTAAKVTEEGSTGVCFANSSGQILTKSSAINYATSEYIEDGWERDSISYTPSATGTYRVGVYVQGMQGDVCADDFQLEVGETPSSANLLQDGAFEKGDLTWWTTQSTTTTKTTGTISGTLQAVTSGAKHEGSYGLTLKGGPAATNRLRQTVYVGCTGEVTFLLSGWAKANAVPIDEAKTRNFNLTAVIKYSDGTEETHKVYFNTDYSGWQYASGPVVPKQKTKTISHINIYPRYDYEANTAYFDQLVLVKEPVQTYSYDADGNLTNAKKGKDAKTSYEYVENTHLLKKYTNAEGVTTELEYDALDPTHNITKVKSGGLTVTNTYTGSNTAGYGNGARTGAVYMSKTESDTGSEYLETASQFTTDNERLAKEADGNNIETTYQYQNYRLSREQTGTSDAVNYTYDSTTGRVAEISSGTTGSEIKLNQQYSNGFVSGVIRETRSGNITSRQRYNYNRDPYGNLVSITVQKESGGSWSSPLTLTTYEYETSVNNGELSQKVYANGDAEEYTYDKYGRLTEETDSEGNTIHYLYNSENELAEKYVTDASQNITERYTFTYDSLGRTIHTRQDDGNGLLQRTEHLYDTADRITSQSWQFGDKAYTEGYTYDTKGNLSTFTPAVGNSLSFSYDFLNRLSQVSGSVYTKNYSYRTIDGSRSSLQVSSLSYDHGSDSTSFTYTYDGNGNILSESDGDQTISYTYDGKDQLIATAKGTRTEQYQYNQAGNLTHTQRRDWLDRIQFHNYYYENDSWSDLLTKVDYSPIAYEGQTFNSSNQTVTGTPVSGNPISYYNGSNRRYTMSWTNGSQLSSVQFSGKNIEYQYDCDGIRKEKTVNGVTWKYITQNGKLVRAESGEVVLDFIYDNQNEPYAIQYSSDAGSSYETYYYVKNLQGDIIKILNSSGEVVARYKYDSWGLSLGIDDGAGESITEDSIGKLNPLRYRGYIYDAETGFYYLNSRYYDPEIARFINADATEVFAEECNLEDNNAFAYCGNNPAIRKDSEGFLFHLIAGAIVGVAVQGIFDIAFGVMEGKTLQEIYRDISLVDYASAAIGGALAATSISSAGSVFANAVIGGATYVGNCKRNHEKVSMVQLGFATLIGAGSGKIGGKGINAKKFYGEYRYTKNLLKTVKSQTRKAKYVSKLGRIRKMVRTGVAGIGKSGTFSNIMNKARSFISQILKR